MHALNATIIKLKNRIIMIRILQARCGDIVGREVKINGLKTIGVRNVPSKEEEDDNTDFTNALVYRIADEEDISSLQVDSTCEVTWE